MREQKITLGEMRGAGFTGLLIYRSDNHCSHHIKISAGEIRFGFPILNYVSAVKLVARANLLSGPTFNPPEWERLHGVSG